MPGDVGAGARGSALAAYEVPEGTEFVSSTVSVAGYADQTMARNASFEAWLESVDPAEDGLEWVGLAGALHLFSHGNELPREGSLVTQLDPPGATFPWRVVLRNHPATPFDPNAINCTTGGCTLLETVGTIAQSGTTTVRDVSVLATSSRGAVGRARRDRPRAVQRRLQRH